MKPNVIIALLVGLVLGFAVGKVASGPSRPGTAPTAAVAPTSEAAFAVKSADMPAGTFTGMTDAQKIAVMKVMNDNTCDCGCGKGSLATCVKTDPGCPNSPAKLKQAVELARQGKSAQDIQDAMFGAGAAKVAQRPKADDSATVFKVPVEGSPIAGSPAALVTMVEFSDYECPFCSRAHATVQQLQQDYGNKLRVVMKHHPLSFHPRAKPAALAALAAGEQGKFWEMHNKLFENSKALGDAELEKYAASIGLKIDAWKKAMAADKLQKVIDQDSALAQQLGATGTPAFFINGRKISGARPIDDFKRVIDEELAKAEKLVAEGVKPEQLYARILEKGESGPPAAPAAPAAAPPSDIKRVEVPADSPFKGPKAAKVTIVEWSDFQCPFCSRVGPTLKQIFEKYPKDVKVVFRHQPLDFHPNAKPAAEAAMAAHEQGKFWEMHDKLFANQGQLDRASFERHAAELKLNVAQFKAALDSGKYRQKIEADAAEGAKVGANGTPTFFINGRLLVGAQPFESFKAIIDEEIGKADKLIAAGTKPEDVYKKLIDQALASNSAPEISISSAPVKGPKNAPITIVAFSDFQCPFCSRAVPTLKQIEEQYGNKVKIAFKHQPLPFHDKARMAAAASMAANEQGKFWEMHDKMFANQGQLDRASLERYASELKLNMDKFKTALDSNKFESLITADSQEGSRLGANGTPTFFINGTKLVGAQPFDAFKNVIDDELKKAGK